ncbi:MAG TPA: hypothetical protein VGG74_18265 [Kofleriaceae bacterium]|jgi:hypothetical protein
MATWTVEMTRERIAALQMQLEWALQYQDQRYYAFARSPRGMRWILLVTLAMGLAGLAFAYMRESYYGYAVAIGAVLGAMISVAIRKIRGSARRESTVRRAGVRLARHAARIYAKPLSQTPYTIDYELRGATIRARITATGVDRATPLAMPRRVVATPDALYLFRHRWSLFPRGLAYSSDAGVRGEIITELERAGADVIQLDGPVDGYLAPLPVVRVV